MRADVALDVRETSHTSAGMLAYVRALRRELPQVAPDLRVEAVGAGDNFDFAEQFALPWTLARRRPRLAHFPTPFVPRIVPVPYVVTVHDVIDLEFPQWAKRKVAPYWRFVVAPVLRGARAVITDDEATVELLVRHCGLDPERARVVPLGVDEPQPLPPPRAHARPYLFYAGNRRPHKDLATLLAAWRAESDAAACDLLVTGRAGGDATAAGAIALGELDERALWAAHRGALAYVHPALREGFGLPMLEALRCGTPVIAADGAVPRVLAPYVYVYRRGDAAALRERLREVLHDPIAARARAAAGAAATRALTWRETARRTVAIYREVLR